MAIENIFFKTLKKNCYVENFKDGGIYFIHPVIKKIHDHCIDSTSAKNEDSTFIKSSILDYYKLKYDFLKKNKVISSDRIQIKKFMSITPKHIVHNLANLKQVTFEVTDACNLKCKYCSYGELYSNYDRRDKKFMDVSNAQEVLSYLYKFWNSKYNLGHNKEIYISFFGGEPLLNMEFIRTIVAYADKLKLKHNHFIFSMTTNGILLNKHIEYLVENNFKLVISLDGNFKDNQYRTYHDGKPSFYRLEKNIISIQNLYPEFFKSNIEFNTVMHNKNSVESVYSYFKSKFNKFPSLGALSFNGVNRQKRDEFINTYKNITESLNESENSQEISDDMFINLPLNSEISLFTHRYSLSTFLNYNELFDENNKTDTLTNGTCSPFGKKLFVTVNGYLLACEKIGHQFKLGMVNEGKVQLSFKKIANIYNSLLNNLYSQCAICYKNTTCNQCMFLIDNLKENPKCKSFLNQKLYQHILSKKISYLESNPKYYTLIKEKIYAEL